MTNTKPQISILGCGWLGLPLASHLLQQGYPVKGSTTREARFPVLANTGTDPYCIRLEEDLITGPIDAFLHNSKILLIDIPPGLRRHPGRDLSKVLTPLLRAVKRSSIKHILYVSSTSVFPDMEKTFDETDSFEPDSDAGKQLRAAERMIMDMKETKNTVIRFGGLLGGDRHPIHSLSGRTGLKDGNNRINLIHRDDCTGLILAVINKNFWGHILHGVAPCHPAKAEYYGRIAEEEQLPPPHFSNTKASHKGKLINAELTAQWLDYTYKHNLCDS